MTVFSVLPDREAGGRLPYFQTKADGLVGLQARD
jgi:hypothetical protein